MIYAKENDDIKDNINVKALFWIKWANSYLDYSEKFLLKKILIIHSIRIITYLEAIRKNMNYFKNIQNISVGT